MPYLNIPWSLYILAVVAPVTGAAEPLGPQLALKDPGHLDTVLCLQEQYGTICTIRYSTVQSVHCGTLRYNLHTNHIEQPYLEHMAAVGGEALDHQQARVPELCAGKILNRK